MVEEEIETAIYDSADVEYQELPLEIVRRSKK